jgi:hypothetical protein
VYKIGKILDHVEEEDGSRQYKVRFIGYGPKSDLWYTDNEMMEWAPGLVAEYKVEEEIRLWKVQGKWGARKEAKVKKNQSRAKKVGNVTRNPDLF